MNRVEILPMLAATPLFSELSEIARAQVGELFSLRTYQPGARIFGCGEDARHYYIVTGGSVALCRTGAPRVTRSRGDGFGELGLVADAQRRADAHAGAQGCQLARLPRLALERLVEEDLERFAPVREQLTARLEPLGIAPREYHDRGALVGTPRVYAFCAPRDGGGRTTLAVNYAALLASDGMRVALVDLDPTGGDVTLLTDIDPVRNWADLFPGDGTQADLSPAALHKFLIPAGAGVFVLPAPVNGAAARRPTPADVGRLLAALGSSFDAVVVDGPSGAGALAECIVAASDIAVVVGQYTYQGVFALNRVVGALAQKGLRGTRVQVVLNRVGRVDDVPAPDRETLIRPSLVRIPEEAEVARAASHCLPDVLARPVGGLADGLRQLRRKLEAIPRRRVREEADDLDARRAQGRARIALGRSLYLRGDHPRAREQLEGAALTLQGDAEAPLLLGRIHEDRGEVRRAAEWFKVAIDADPEDLHPLARLAFLTRNPAQAAGAKRRLAIRIDRFPQRADYHLLQGLLAESCGEEQAADEAYSTALQVHPGYAEAFRRRGDLARRIGRPELALEFYGKACALSPVEVAAYAGRVSAAEELGLIGPAHEACKDLHSLQADYPGCRLRLTELGQRRRATQSEIESYDRALSDGKAFPDVLLLRAGARMRLGDLGGAASDAARALGQGASLPGARLLLRKVRMLGPLIEGTGKRATLARAA